MKFFIAAVLVAISSASLEKDQEHEFMQHIAKYALSYPTLEEFEYRANLYFARDADIKEFNSSNQTSTVAHNQFSTYSQTELSRLRMLQPSYRDRITTSLETTTLPDSVNWVTAGKVTSVKN